MSRYRFSISIEANSQDEAAKKLANIKFQHPEMGALALREGVTAEADLKRAIAKLGRYGRARNRQTDREIRTVSLTDDEAVALLEGLEEKSREPDGSGG